MTEFATEEDEKALRKERFEKRHQREKVAEKFPKKNRLDPYHRSTKEVVDIHHLNRIDEDEI